MTRLSRRQALFGGLTLAAVAASQPIPVLAEPTDPLAGINERLDELERRHNAIIGVHAVDIETGRNVGHRDTELFAVCSTFKTYAAAAVLQKSERGELALDQKVFVDPAEIVTNSPRTQPRAGGEMTLDELCQAALQVSDNTAGNLLLQTIGGTQAITEFARSIDDEATRLDRWETELNSAIPGDPRDTSTPHMIGRGYRNLLTHDVLAPPQRQQLEDWMRANETSSMRAGLPAGWTTADKTGSGDYGSTNDVGVAYDPAGRRVLLAMMTRSKVNDPKAQNLRPLIAELTKLLIPVLLV
jgi:beta-lactamase class A